MTQFNSINKFGTDMFDEDIDEAIDDLESGGTGTVDYGGKVISNVGNPELPNDVATKVYVDVNDSIRLTRSVGAAQALTGDLYLGNHKIKEVQTPTDDNDAVNINYFNARIGDFCSKSGFTMTGEIQMSENILYLNPTSYLHADSVGLKINSNDTYFTNGTTNIMNILPNKVVLLQELDANDKNIVNLPTPSLPTHAVNLGYLDSNYCKRSGFSMVGAIEMGGNVLRFAGGNIAHINDTLYIDSKEIAFSRLRSNMLLLNGSGINTYLPLNMANYAINFLGGSIYSRAGLLVIRGPGPMEDIIISDVITLNKTIDVNNKFLYNVPIPTTYHHAANKKYVDNLFGDWKRYASITSSPYGHPRITNGINIETNISQGIFDFLPTGQFGCLSTSLDVIRRGSLPMNVKGYLRVVQYSVTPNNRFFEWINGSNGDRWIARITEGTWVEWRRTNSLELSETNSIQHDLDMGGYQITNLGSPTSGTSGANKDYVDSVSLLSVAKAGDVMTGNLIMSGYFINNIHDPIFDGDAVNKGYAISLNNLKVSKSGDTMTGILNMNNNYIRNLPTPTLSGDAATMNYVDTVGNTKVSKTGDTMGGVLDMNGYNLNGLPVTLPGLAGNSSAMSYGLFLGLLGDFGNTVVKKVGDSMTGSLSMGGNYIINVADPAAATDVANKRYVDTADNTKVSKTGDIMDGDLYLDVGSQSTRIFGCDDLNGTKNFIILLGTPTEKIQCEVGQPVTTFTNNGLLVKSNSNNVARFGLTSSDPRIGIYQDIVMDQKFIANLHDPTSNQDAATKRYVDIRLVRNTNPIIPNLTGLTGNKGGYVVTQTSQAGANFSAWRIWNYIASTATNGGGEWAANGASNQNVTIQLPFAVRTWRLDLVGRIGYGFFFNSWRLDASNNNVTYTPLVTSTNIIDTTYRTYTFDSLIAYSYYRFVGLASTPASTNPGLTVFQLYQLDVLQ